MLQIEYEDMKWPTDDPNRIPFCCLSSQFLPPCCCAVPIHAATVRCMYFSTQYCLLKLFVDLETLT